MLKQIIAGFLVLFGAAIMAFSFYLSYHGEQGNMVGIGGFVVMIVAFTCAHELLD